MKFIRLLTLSVLIFALTAAAGWAADPSGTWKFNVEGPNGKSLEATLTLKLEGEQLTGTIDNRAGKKELTDAQFSGDQITFSVMREFRKQKLVTHYTGKVEGDAIKGTINATGRKGRPVTVPWVAQRVK